MKPLIPLVLLGMLSACSMTNTTFNRPYAPPEASKPETAETPEIAVGERTLVARVVAVERADRVRVDVTGWPALFGADLPITLTGVHLPQLPGQCPEEAAAATEAAKRVETLLSQARKIELSDLSRAKQFGLNARIWLDDQPLDQTLLSEGIAQKARTDWCP
ncbi:hypothetical protein [Ferrimonas balearica]|uniref:hypothetical protein n=1 Tax=Ferrimonas balearica TaxID=44012 RepID=UPI001C997922|nr:hypothetical protein [Ferrimonas balearica]MBY5923038.1 hypothetical protein [Ferrimonas balearica]MBY5997585.1 hypothetical protein [Ferrimonas balearica]